MNIKYNKKKQVIKEDPVLGGLLKTKEYLTKNSSSVTVVAIVALVVVGLVFGFNRYRLNKTEKARNAFGNAMIAYNENDMEGAARQFQATVENYKGSISAPMAAYMLANVLSNQGKYDKAIEWYTKVLNGKDIGFVSVQAHEGIAACYEAQNNNNTAIEHLKTAIADERAAYRYSALRWKLALLTKDADTAKAIELCDEIIADTLAQNYGPEARYLKAMLAK